MHSVLDGWPDSHCVSILSRIKEAMKPEYSKLLIKENCILDTGAHCVATALDMMMLGLFATEESTEHQ